MLVYVEEKAGFSQKTSPPVQINRLPVFSAYLLFIGALACEFEVYKFYERGHVVLVQFPDPGRGVAKQAYATKLVVD